MKKFLLSVVLVAACLPGVAPAQRVWLGVHASHYHYGGAPSLDVDGDRVNMPGLQFGYQPWPRWSFRGWWERSGIASDGFDDPRLELGLVSVRWHSTRLGLRPWLGLGVGELMLEADGRHATSDTVAGPEAGVDVFAHENWSLGLGARALYSDSLSEWDGAVFLSLDVGLRLGHNHLPRVQALREARERTVSPASLPPPRRCLARPIVSPRERHFVPSTGCATTP